MTKGNYGSPVVALYTCREGHSLNARSEKRMPCVACWLHQSGAREGFPLDRTGKEKKKKKNTFLTTHGKAELWRATHTCCSEGACFTYSPSDQRAGFSLAPRVYILWLGVSQRAEKERGEHDIDVTASRGWMNHSSNNGAPVTEVLSVCHRWES